MAMRVCFIAPKAYPLFNPQVQRTFGGAEVQMYLLARELAKDDAFDVHFIVADYGQDALEEHVGVLVHKAHRLEDGDVARARAFLSTLIGVDADVYVQRSLHPASALVALLCRFSRRRFVYMVSNDIEVDGRYAHRKGDLYYRVASQVFRLAHTVVVQNSYQEEMLSRRGTTPVLLRSSHPIPTTLQQTAKHMVLWVGRIEERKRPEVFLHLAQENSDRSFVMVASEATGKGAYHEKVSRAARAIPNLVLYSYKPFDEIDRVFREAILLINTSEYEGFPNTFVQAAKNATPILSLGVNPDGFLDKYECGFSCNDDFETLNTRLRLLTSDEKLYKRMAENGFRYAKENHDIEKNIKVLHDLLLG